MRRRPRIRTTVLIVVSIKLLFLFYYVALKPYPCQKSAVDSVCGSWKAGLVDGDWCFQLCDAVKSCHGFAHYGKQLVVRLEGQFGRAVAKSRYTEWQDDQDPPLDPTHPIRDFKERAAAFINNVHKIEQIDRFIDQRILPLAISEQARTDWLRLLKQREFIWSMLFTWNQLDSPFPELRGTCSHLFIVKETDETLNSISSWTLIERLQTANTILELIRTLDKLNIEACDFKWEHFGLNFNMSSSRAPFEAKLLDLDAVYSKRSLQINMDNYKCQTDSDCDFFDCKGKCMQDSGVRDSFCVRLASDSNLQRFLRMVSSSLIPPQQSFFRGVRNAQLLNYVNKCRNSICDTAALQHLLTAAIFELKSE